MIRSALNKTKFAKEMGISRSSLYYKPKRPLIDEEVKRQIEVLEEGGEIIQETRGWDENKQKTFSQRVKEGSADYRYFPDPDLPKLKLSEIAEFNKDVLENALPELPWEKRERFLRDFGIKEEDVEMYVIDETYRNLFEAVVIEIGDNKDLIKLASNYITSDLVGMVKNSEVGGVENVDKDNFSELIKMVGENKVSSRGAKDILKILFEKGGNSKKIAEENNLLQKNDISDLKNVVEKVIIENQETVKEYKKGKETAIKYLMGQAMKATKGSANPKVLQDLLKSLLKE